MNRRAATTQTEALPGLDPAYLAAKEKLAAGKSPGSRSHSGSTAAPKEASIIGFGGMVVKDVTPKEAANFVAEAVDRGVNYFDVAPFYGNAQERLGPALKPYREKCFLACKTLERDAAGAAKELKQSLKLLKTDHFDLYQLHALTDVEEVEQAFGPGGAMETILKAQQDGKIRYIGFSAHSEEAAHAAMDRFDFDSILFPLSFPFWIKGKFGPSVYQRATKAGMGILALKAMAHQSWPEDIREQAEMEQDVLRTVRRDGQGGLGSAVHPAPARDGHVPAGPLGVVQDGVGLGPGGGIGAAERRGAETHQEDCSKVRSALSVARVTRERPQCGQSMNRHRANRSLPPDHHPHGQCRSRLLTPFATGRFHGLKDSLQFPLERIHVRFEPWQMIIPHPFHGFSPWCCFSVTGE